MGNTFWRGNVKVAKSRRMSLPNRVNYFFLKQWCFSCLCDEYLSEVYLFGDSASHPCNGCVQYSKCTELKAGSLVT